jgi:hypothetical protein
MEAPRATSVRDIGNEGIDGSYGININYYNLCAKRDGMRESEYYEATVVAETRLSNCGRPCITI